MRYKADRYIGCIVAGIHNPVVHNLRRSRSKIGVHYFDHRDAPAVAPFFTMLRNPLPDMFAAGGINIIAIG